MNKASLWYSLRAPILLHGRDVHALTCLVAMRFASSKALVSFPVTLSVFAVRFPIASKAYVWLYLAKYLRYLRVSP